MKANLYGVHMLCVDAIRMNVNDVDVNGVDTNVVDVIVTDALALMKSCTE